MSGPFKTQAEAILHFYDHLRPRFPLQEGVSIMNPFEDPTARKIAGRFYEKFYGDDQPRVYLVGINPGRFGAGVTGVPFTDPLRLQEKCGIPNDWKKQPELSSQFIYEVIDAFGGVGEFYSRFFFTAMFPLAFIQGGKNLNYYDDKKLLKTCEPFIVDCMRRQQATIPTFPTCFCLGEGENYKQFSRINQQHGFFKEIIPLSHPRWVMQYRRKKMKEYTDLYVRKLKGEPTP
jgi:hypothetical protein